jgi:RNA-directed DNA polymerase
VPERATVLSRSEKSAEAVVGDVSRSRAERVEQPRDVSLGAARHQKPGPPGRAGVRAGVAGQEAASDEAALARCGQTNCGADDLLGQALARENVGRAWKRVKANKGSAGVDGRTVQDTAEYLKHAWPDIRQRLLDGTYKPEPVRRVSLPKPGGGTRELGIPTVTDRLIQQALLQVLQPLVDPTFSAHSYGFRPGRSAHQAVLAAKAHVEAGYRTVVDVDLEKFFDRVNHDILMDRLAKRIADKRVLRLVRRYLRAGILKDGVCSNRHVGTPQGGPLSPLLANVLLDEVDRELERRGHCFVRYADDCNVYVRSQRAGERVLQALRGCYARLALKVNESKTAVGPVGGRKCLGYCLRATAKGQVMCSVAAEALARLRERLRTITKRQRGRSIEQVVDELSSLVPGWKAYFRLASSKRARRELDEWLRHRLRALHLRHWRHGSTIYRELRRLGASSEDARVVAANTGRWWHNSAGKLNRVLSIAYFDKLGVPRFS